MRRVDESRVDVIGPYATTGASRHYSCLLIRYCTAMELCIL